MFKEKYSHKCSKYNVVNANEISWYWINSY